jgi:hypothetical protein
MTDPTVDGYSLPIEYQFTEVAGVALSVESET